jgi:RNA polymerase sigma factor (sigma-70 family)
MADDPDLVHRANAGEESAFGALWKAHRPQLASSLLAQVPPALRPGFPLDDVLQETAAAAWVGMQRGFDPDGKAQFATWLQQIAHHKLTDQVRYETALRRDTGRTLPTGLGDEEALFDRLAAELSTPSRVCTRQDAVRHALALIPDLPAALRHAVEVLILDGQPLRTAASRVGCAPSTLWRRRDEAVRFLRERLERVGISSWSH